MTIKENNGFFSIKNVEWYENQKIAGEVLFKALKEAKLYIEKKDGASTKKINDLIETVIRDNNCIPTFLGYMNFPAAVCISLNKELVHGIPKEDVIIKDGDIVKIDAGVTYKNSVADSAFTIGIGDIDIKNRMLIEQTKKALINAISYIKEEKTKGNVPTVGGIGYIIKKTANQIGANVIMNYSGHGIEDGTNVHWSPMIMNNGDKNKGPRIYSGMTFAIEPMLLYGSNKTKVDKDQWTVLTETIGCHYETTLFIKENDVEIVTEIL